MNEEEQEGENQTEEKELSLSMIQKIVSESGEYGFIKRGFLVIILKKNYGFRGSIAREGLKTRLGEAFSKFNSKYKGKGKNLHGVNGYIFTPRRIRFRRNRELIIGDIELIVEVIATYGKLKL